MAKRKKSSTNTLTPMVASYNSFQEFLNDNLTDIAPHIRSEWREGGWIGGGLYDTADSLIEDLQKFGGALPPVQKLYTPTDLVIQGHNGVAEEYIFDMSGQSFDIGLVCEGIPESWLSTQEMPSAKDNLTIRIKHGVSGGTDNEQATKKFMAIADLYKACLSKYRVRVVIEWWAKPILGNESREYHYEIQLCGFDDYFDPLTLVSVCSVTMFRAIMLGLGAKAFGGKKSDYTAWSDSWEKYFRDGKTYAERTENEIILPPIHLHTQEIYELPNLLRSAGITTEGE